MSNQKILVDVIGLSLIALVLVVGYKLAPVLSPKADLTVQPEPSCNLQRETCAVALPGGGAVEFGSSVHPLPLARPFRIEARVSGIEVRRIEVDFAGIDMNMGLIRPQLAAQGGERYAAELSLPVCVTGAMDWQATLLLETADRRLAVPFRFRAGGAD